MAEKSADLGRCRPLEAAAACPDGVDVRRGHRVAVDGGEALERQAVAGKLGRYLRQPVGGPVEIDDERTHLRNGLPMLRWA